MMKTEKNITEIGTYNLTTGNGRHIRKATVVRFDDSSEIKFIERMPKYMAIENALYQANKN